MMDEAITGGGQSEDKNNDDTTSSTTIIPPDWAERGNNTGVMPWKKPIPLESLPKVRKKVRSQLKESVPGDTVMEGGLKQK